MKTESFLSMFISRLMTAQTGLALTSDRHLSLCSLSLRAGAPG